MRRIERRRGRDSMSGSVTESSERVHGRVEQGLVSHYLLSTQFNSYCARINLLYSAVLLSLLRYKSCPQTARDINTNCPRTISHIMDTFVTFDISSESSKCVFSDLFQEHPESDTCGISAPAADMPINHQHSTQIGTGNDYCVIA